METVQRVLRRVAGGALLLVAAAGLPGCRTIERAAIDRLGDALAGAGTSVYATDDDPEFVRDALPFGLKTIEGLLLQRPRHRGLLLAASSGFTQYGYAFLQGEADLAEDADPARAQVLRERAARMYRRALGYALRDLDEASPGWRERWARDGQAALGAFGRRDVPSMYWAAATWGAAIALDKQDAEMAADLPLAVALMRRAAELEPGWGAGAIQDFFISYEGGLPAAAGGSLARAREAFDRAVALSGGRRAAPYVAFAETVAVGQQDRPAFRRLLGQALAIDPGAAPEQRLANLVAQKRARWLLAREDQLFVE